MKNKYIALLSILAILLVWGCKKENDDDSGVISNLASTHLQGRRSQARVVVFLRRVSAESVRSGPSLLGAAPPRAVARIAQRRPASRPERLKPAPQALRGKNKK